MEIDIRELKKGDVAIITTVDGGNGWNSNRAIWDQYLSDHATIKRTVLIAWRASRPVGYGKLSWESDYEPFRSLRTPDINNLSVDLAQRRRGFGTALIRAFEDTAKKARRSEIGIDVGLYPDYANAQRLYWRLAYRPDGRGVTYGGRSVKPGEQVRLDDELLLWLSKRL